MPTFDDVRLPEDIESGATGGATFQTSIIPLTSGFEQRVSNWSQTRAAWDIGYGVQEPEDFNVVEQFFLERRGKLHSFRFKDWHDFQVTGQNIGTGDAASRTFLFVKSYGDYDRRITRPVAGTVSVYVDAVLQNASTYDLVTSGGYIKFHEDSIPADGAVITATFQYDNVVRFDVDDLKLMLYWQRAGTIPNLPVIEVRDNINAAPTALTLINKITTLADDFDLTYHANLTASAAIGVGAQGAVKGATATEGLIVSVALGLSGRFGPASLITNSHGLRVADVLVTDDPFGVNVLSLSGADAASFQLVGDINLDGTGVSLYLKPTVTLDGLAKPTYNVTVNVTDFALSNDASASADYTLTLTVVARPPEVALSNIDASLADNEDVSNPIQVATVVVTQHGTTAANNVLSLSGADAASFTVGPPTNANGAYTSPLYINAGVTTPGLGGMPLSYDVTVEVSNADFPSPPQDTASLTVTFGVVGVSFIDDIPGTRGWVVPQYQTLVCEGWGGGAGASGRNVRGHDGTETHITAMSLVAGGGKVSTLTLNGGVVGAGQYEYFNTQPGAGGLASGGDVATNGAPGSPGYFSRVAGPYTLVGSTGGTAPGTGGGAGGVAVTATSPAEPAAFTGDGSPAASADNEDGNDGTGPGGGGGGPACLYWQITIALTDYGWKLYANARPGAGSGAYFRKTFTRGVTSGAPVPGATITYTVGAKGLGGSDVASGGDGGHARIKFTVA